MMTTEPIRLIDAGVVPPMRSQTIYHAIAHALDESTPDTIILVSPMDPYVCIGVHQELEKEVDTDYCRAQGLPMIRREVGGGAVYLDKNQLFVQWIFRVGHLPLGLADRFDLYVRPLVLTYNDLGIDAYFRPVNDVHVAGKKIGGTGAARINSAEIVVGSFVLDFNKATMAKVLRVASEKMRDKVSEALAQYMTTMHELLGEPPPREEIVALYAGHCEKTLGRPLVPGELTQSELTKAEDLDVLFASAEWLQQKGGLRQSHVKIHEDVRVAEVAHKAPGGLIRVTARLSTRGIDDVAISGDFTMVPTCGPRYVEEALVGCAIDREALECAVSAAYEAGALQSPGVEPADIVDAVLLLQEHRL